MIFSDQKRKQNTHFTLLLVALCVLLCFWLRTRGMEYASVSDDQWLGVTLGKMVADTNKVPAEGMYSSVGVPNPPGSAAVFGLLYKLSPQKGDAVTRAIWMSWWVGVLNALFLCVFFSWLKRIPETAKESLFLFGMVAVSPWAVHWSRAIWAQEFLLWFQLPALACVVAAKSQLMARSKFRRIGLWFLGFFFAGLSAQMHISGFFFAATLGILFCLEREFSRMAKLAVLAAAGAIAVLHFGPWIPHAIDGFRSAPHTPKWTYFGILAKLQIFPQLLKTLLGLGWVYFIGPAHAEIWRHPVPGWTLGLTLVSFISGLLLLVAWTLRPKEKLDLFLIKFFAVYSLLAFLIAKEMQPHYLIPLMVLQWWIVMRAVQGPGFWVGKGKHKRFVRPDWIAAVWIVVQLGLTLNFQNYLFKKGGNPTGPYGVGVAFQKAPCEPGKFPAPSVVFPRLAQCKP